MNEMPGKGQLRIWTTEAGGSLPVRGVPVQIRNEGGELLHVLRTGESGLRPTVALPAPAAADSQRPGSAARPYADYIVSVEMPGYQPVRELTVPIFDGITSLQPITLLPAAAGSTPQGQPYLVYPEVPYSRLRQGSVTPEDPVNERDGRRPLTNPPDSEDIPDFDEGEAFLDDNDLPEYGRDIE